MRLSPKDYISILKFYDIDSSKMNAKKIKQQAESILAEKLCRCIKSVDKGNSIRSKGKQSKGKQSKGKQSKNKTERKSIAICKNSVLTKKHLKISKFTCDKPPKLMPRTGHNNTLIKTKRKLLLKKKVPINILL
jgi:hypothetical protein